VTDPAPWGLWSLTPLVITLVLAFWSRSALIAMLVGTFAGTLMLGGVPGVSLNELFQQSLGSADFIWIVEIVVLIGILFEGFKLSGVLGRLAGLVGRGGGLSRRRVAVTTWGLGFVIVDDYFSPLMTGAVMRPLADRAMMPREKLAFILDATTASVCILVPFTAWGAYMASLIAASGAGLQGLDGVDAALGVFVQSIPYNFYPMLLLLFALGICLGWIPDFGPMRHAEKRVVETGALIRPGSRPLVDDSVLDDSADGSGSMLLELGLPVAVVIGIGVGSLAWLGTIRIVEAFLAGVLVLVVVLRTSGKLGSAADVAQLITRGAESVMPALLIVALAYALNEVARQLGVGAAIIELFSGDASADWLVPLTFILTSAIAFSTGTSWGAFALMMPVSLPAAVALSDGQAAPLVYQTVAAIAGGGIFGDHSSPVSDTTVLSSLGAGSDHMDHVITQLPYALLMGGVAFGLYVLL
jgi:Na+/H+ antiporter NhaC